MSAVAILDYGGADALYERMRGHAAHGRIAWLVRHGGAAGLPGGLPGAPGCMVRPGARGPALICRALRRVSCPARLAYGGVGISRRAASTRRTLSLQKDHPPCGCEGAPASSWSDRRGRCSFSALARSGPACGSAVLLLLGASQFWSGSREATRRAQGSLLGAAPTAHALAGAGAPLQPPAPAPHALAWRPAEPPPPGGGGGGFGACAADPSPGFPPPASAPGPVADALARLRAQGAACLLPSALPRAGEPGPALSLSLASQGGSSSLSSGGWVPGSLSSANSLAADAEAGAGQHALRSPKARSPLRALLPAPQGAAPAPGALAPQPAAPSQGLGQGFGQGLPREALRGLALQPGAGALQGASASLPLAAMQGMLPSLGQGGTADPGQGTLLSAACGAPPHIGQGLQQRLQQAGMIAGGPAYAAPALHAGAAAVPAPLWAGYGPHLGAYLAGPAPAAARGGAVHEPLLPGGSHQLLQAGPAAPQAGQPGGAPLPQGGVDMQGAGVGRWWQ